MQVPMIVWEGGGNWCGIQGVETRLFVLGIACRFVRVRLGLQREMRRKICRMIRSRMKWRCSGPVGLHVSAKEGFQLLVACRQLCNF